MKSSVSSSLVIKGAYQWPTCYQTEKKQCYETLRKGVEPDCAEEAGLQLLTVTRSPHTTPLTLL